MGWRKAEDGGEMEDGGSGEKVPFPKKRREEVSVKAGGVRRFGMFGLFHHDSVPRKLFCHQIL